MADKTEFSDNVEALFKGLDGFLTTKTVVGEPIKICDSTMIPLADISFGLAAGAYAGNSKNNGGGGMGAKASPAAVLMIDKDGTTRLVSLKNQDAVAKILDMAPDIVTKIKDAVGGNKTEEKHSPEFEEFEE